MVIHGLNKTTLLDFPGHLACTVFTGYCNLRCPFCQNGELVLCPESQPAIPEEEFFDFLDKRKKRLEGVAITGGEPTVSPDLVDFIKKIKDLGFLVKLDSNGLRPDILKYLIDNSLVDYFAMDIKSSKEKYPVACGLNQLNLSAIEESVKILMNSPVEYEFRTTVSRELHTEKEFREIAEWIKGCSNYYLQSYRPSDAILANMMDDDFRNSFPASFTSYKPEELKVFCELLNSLGVNAHLRGIA
ncbi:MAG: anaerobic ribonucleoside-triphosphate reductase activating protein [Lachnospiraceae bacterium]|nr:anaerobic ribonucleoside-triphosphate reductase activating protein [Lachnospiraceae bacterium]